MRWLATDDYVFCCHQRERRFHIEYDWVGPGSDAEKWTESRSLNVWDWWSLETLDWLIGMKDQFILYEWKTKFRNVLLWVVSKWNKYTCMRLWLLLGNIGTKGPRKLARFALILKGQLHTVIDPIFEFEKLVLGIPPFWNKFYVTSSPGFLSIRSCMLIIPLLNTFRPTNYIQSVINSIENIPTTAEGWLEISLCTLFRLEIFFHCHRSGHVRQTILVSATSIPEFSDSISTH